MANKLSSVETEDEATRSGSNMN